MAKGDTKTNQYLDIAANGTRNDFPASCCETRSQTLIREVGERIMDLEDEVERLENNPDVADIVATYADLQAYDTSQLTDKDIIRVLQDETHDGDSTYYRWSTATDTWTYVGESKQYTDFVGTDGSSAGTAGLVPAPAATDSGKFLKADGTWDTAGGSSVNVVQTTGTSTTDVMSQNAVTSMVFADPATQQKIKIGAGASSSEGADGVEIGHNAYATGRSSIAIGPSSNAQGISGVAIGGNAQSGNQPNSIALGSYSVVPDVRGVMSIGGSATNKTLYNNSNYRLLTGLYDGQNAHDAVTKGQLDTAVINGGTTAPTTATVGAVGTLYSYVDTTGATPAPHLMSCTAVDTTTDPQNPSYTWTTLV